MPPSIDSESLGFLITDVSRLIRAEMDRRIAEAGLGVTPGEGRALAHAARVGEVRQNVLAERIGVEAMTVSSYLDRLEARGLIERVPDPKDGRAKLVRLTAAADETLARISELSAELRADLAKGLSGDDWSKLLDGLKVLREELCAIRVAARREREAA